VLISLPQAVSPYLDKPLKSVTHGQCNGLTYGYLPSRRASPLCDVFLQNTRCSTHTYHSRRQKFRSRRTARLPLAVSTETRRVQDCMSGTPIADVNSTDVQYLSADIQLVSEHGRRHLRSSSYRTLAVPRTRTTRGDRSFAVAGPRVWNSLPAAIRQITSYGQFRQHLKTHLFRA